MNKEEFLELAREYDDQAILQFTKAIDFAQQVLGDKKRLAGDTFLEHNLRVAAILMETKSAPELVVAGILHGILKNGARKEISKQFGEEIVHLIEGVEEIKEIKSKNKQLEAEALRRILFTTLKDVRVIFIKLANKLDNLRSIDVLPKEEQRRIAEEVLEIYAPLAYRLGAEKIRVQLENRAFQILHPRKYQEIANFLEESREEREKIVLETIDLIKKVAQGEVSILKIKGRSKHVYSIFKKIVEGRKKLHQQYDLFGIRVIVPEVKDCYTLLGLLHEKFTPVEGRLKDYIANPKPNFYRSLHTAIRLPSEKVVEVQIRTPEMDEFAEEGVAAHWRYKKVKADQFFEKKISWLRNVLNLGRKSKEFLETAKIDVFGDAIYCYTPKGDLKELPKGATILDFAYLVHEEVGSKTVGGRVNGRFVSIKHELAHGDVVEVVTNKNQRPRRSWIKVVKSGRARQKIRKSLRQHEKLPALHFRQLKPLIKEEQGVLVSSEEFPKAICVLAKCCRALPGEEIVGIVTKRRVVSVHREDCRAALKEENRWVPVQWKETFGQKIGFFIEADERSGLLADLLHTIASAGFEVKEAKAKLINAEKEQCSFLVVPRDLEHLEGLIGRVRKVKGVKKIYFG